MTLNERLAKQKSKGDGELSPVLKTQPETGADYSALMDKVHGEIIELINKDTSGLDKERDYLLKTIDTLLEVEDLSISRIERNKIAQDIYNNVAGLGILQPLLDDPEITEIMVNGPFNVYIERHGKLELSSVTFRDSEQVMDILNRIVSSVGRRIDESSPMVDARLADGSRVNAIIPPLALRGPTITIRKFSKNPLTVSDLIQYRSASAKMMYFLEACVKGKLNIVVSGGTGSGKTTLLGILSGFIPDNERIITIEDAAELQFRQNHVVTLESRPANIEGAGEISIRSLVKNALRMRPDRIVVGEVRSSETLDMLQAMNTGHSGSMTTAHANSPRDVLSRIETMVLMSGMEIPIKAIREQISSAIDLIVQQSRLKDGSRKIVAITEVSGMEGDTITLQNIFEYRTGLPDGTGRHVNGFAATGIRPGFIEKLEANGVSLRDDWFIN